VLLPADDSQGCETARTPAHGDKEVGGVARPWRIRHKLMLGLGLVVGIMALLLGGTLFGLLSYMDTMKTVDSKLAELKVASELKERVNALTAPYPGKTPDYPDEVQYLQPRVSAAREALDAYGKQLQNTVDRHRDPDGGFQELGLIKALEERFGVLDQAIADFHKDAAADPGGSDFVQADHHVQAATADLVRTTDELLQAIYQDMYKRITASRGYSRWSMIIVLSTSILGVLLMAGLLRFFYTWVFYPIRDLEAGAGRVAQGDLDHRIEVHSGDEMEELANAFNNMTDRLCEIYRDLNRQVNERSRQLVRSERLASVGFLAAGVAHEINNPLQAITLYSGALEARLAELVRRLQQPGVPEKAAVMPDEQEVLTKYLKTILEEAFRCKRITERLLEFSRGGEPHRELIDMTELVQAVLDVAQPLQSCKGKEINFEAAGQVTAWANADEIKSVVLNLVVNALDSMEEGGRLTIRLRPSADLAELVLTDTGCGMNADVLENIFEPFFTRSRTGKGTGLGLTISHRIITQHAGEIEAASPGPDRGSTFTVRLPRHPAEEPASTTREADAEAGRRRAA
jgi:two-component system NtrC family sensor kinase